MDLREKIAKAVWDEWGTYEIRVHESQMLEIADVILVIPEIAEALRVTADGGELDVYRTNCTCNLD